jgi:hypothetical protein
MHGNFKAKIFENLLYFILKMRRSKGPSCFLVQQSNNSNSDLLIYVSVCTTLQHEEGNSQYSKLRLYSMKATRRLMLYRYIFIEINYIRIAK